MPPQILPSARLRCAAEFERRGTSITCMVGKGAEAYVMTREGKQFIPLSARALSICSLDEKKLTPTRICGEIGAFWERKLGKNNVKIDGLRVSTVKKIDGVIYEDCYPMAFGEKLPKVTLPAHTEAKGGFLVTPASWLFERVTREQRTRSWPATREQRTGQGPPDREQRTDVDCAEREQSTGVDDHTSDPNRYDTGS